MILGASTASLLIRLVVSLGIVVGLMLLASKTVRKRGYGGSAAAPKKGAPKADVEVLARKGLSKNSSIVVIRAGGRNLVLGVSDNNVTLLTEADEVAVEQELAQDIAVPRTGPTRSAPRSDSAWKALLDHMRERTVRRIS
jgi:flagellar biogenesis protein FliO